MDESNSIIFKTLVVSRTNLLPNTESFSFSKYKIDAIPSRGFDGKEKNHQFLLSFPRQNEIRENDVKLHSYIEANQITAILSLILGTNIQVDSIMIDNRNIGSVYRGAFEEDTFFDDDHPFAVDTFFKKVNSLDIETSKQFYRSTNLFHTALNLLGVDNAASYFLLTVSIACLSNFQMKYEDEFERFASFIIEYLDKKKYSESEAEIRALLKEVYFRHRNNFLKGGSDLPEAAYLSDNLNRTYVKNIIDGKVVKTPGLKWFVRLVRNVLTAFINKQEIKMDEINDRLQEIALEVGDIALILKDPQISEFDENIHNFEEIFDLD